MQNHVLVSAALGAALLLAACAPQAPGRGGEATSSLSARPSILRVAVSDDVPQFSMRIGDWHATSNRLINAFLASTDERAVVHPYLLEKLPSQEDGTWILGADGTMQTILTLRPGIKWHDGEPLTSHDIVFAYRIYRDREVPNQWADPERLISSVEPRDDRTVTVHWSQPYFEAGFPAERDLLPLPRHLLEELYNRDKQSFIASSFWISDEYVGAGPYRVSERDHGVQVVYTANPDFFLGKPKIDRIELKVVADRNAIVSRLLAGDIDFTEEILPDHAALLREQWGTAGAGTVYVDSAKIRTLVPQQRDVPNHQPALRDIRVRRALMHAIDREAVAHASTSGLSKAADSFFSTSDRLWPRIEQVIVKYPYDPRRSEALLAEAGWARGADSMLHDSTGRSFDLEVSASANRFRDVPPIADYFKRVGIDARPILVPPGAEREATVSFAGVELAGGEPIAYYVLTSTEHPLAANRWTGRNSSSFSHPEIDALVSRLNASLSSADRDDLFVAIERFITTELPRGPLLYDVAVAAGLSHVRGVKGHSKARNPSYLFNTYEWWME